MKTKHKTFTLTPEEVEIVRKALANTKSLFSISQREILEDLKTRITNGKIKLWIARDKDGGLYLWRNKPTCGMDGKFYGGTLRGALWGCLFPEITFENSPQQVELKLIEK